MKRTLIVPLIGSIESDRTLQTARTVARTFGRRLVLVHAVPQRHPQLSRADEVHARREVETLADGLRSEGIAAEAHVRRAEPGTAIAEAVRAFDARAIVRSSDAGNDLAGWLRRTIVDEAMRQLQIPVLIIPTGEMPTPAPGARLRVLVPLDGSAPAESALVHLLGIARPRPLAIRLVDVVHQRLGPLGARLPSVPDSKAARRATTRYLHDVAAALHAEDVTTEADVIESQDSVDQVLLDLARQSAVDVVVMATHGLNTPGHLPQSMLTTSVVEHCPVPVLLVPSASPMEPAGHVQAIRPRMSQTMLASGLT